MRFSRLVMALGLATLLLGAPGVGAAPAKSLPASQAGSEALTALKRLVGSLLAATEQLGCEIDPLGGLCVQRMRPSGDLGCEIDPLGGTCVPQR
jgi:hypothetical protein